MPAYVALLRGINVGKAKRVPMADLRALMTDLGYTDVATLLNSGNAVFRAAKGKPDKLAADIAAAIAATMQVEVPVIVKSAADIDAAVAENSIAADAPDHSRLLVAFAQGGAALAGLSAIAKHVVAPEQFLVGQAAAYLHCAGGILESKAGKALVGKIGASVTTRNWATVLKLQAMLKDLGG